MVFDNGLQAQAKREDQERGRKIRERSHELAEKVIALYELTKLLLKKAAVRPGLVTVGSNGKQIMKIERDNLPVFSVAMLDDGTIWFYLSLEGWGCFISKPLRTEKGIYIGTVHEADLWPVSPNAVPIDFLIGEIKQYLQVNFPESKNSIN